MLWHWRRSDGLGFGDNTKAALMTRGMAEMKLNSWHGKWVVRRKPLRDFPVLGDLIVTCTVQSHSRNRRAGILLGAGKSLQETLDEAKMVVEGVEYSAGGLSACGKNITFPCPLHRAFMRFLCGKNVEHVVLELMTRDNRGRTSIAASVQFSLHEIYITFSFTIHCGSILWE
ncbi:MAG: NAD(P)H-dependent glycerol-3-phosphate dehydrogenase [Anaerotignum faecicola]